MLQHDASILRKYEARNTYGGEDAWLHALLTAE